MALQELCTFGLLISSPLRVYFFLMQRAAIEIGRSRNLDASVSRVLLPLWYIAVWPVHIVWWGSLFLLLHLRGWASALIVWLLFAFATTFWPIPFAHFLSIFKRSLTDSSNRDSEHRHALQLALLAFVPPR